jgi:hypothetical protein
MRITLLLPFLLCTIGCSPSDSTCHPADGVTQQYRSIIGATITDDYRRRAFRLDSVNSEDVRLVSDPTVCAKAGRVLAAMKKRPSRSYAGPLNVYQVGTSFGVIDEHTGGDYDGVYFFDSNWRLSGSQFAQ